MADMWTLINRELAKIEELRGGASEPSYYDAIKEGMEYGMEQRAWNERQNEQRLGIMIALHIVMLHLQNFHWYQVILNQGRQDNGIRRQRHR